MAEAVYILGVLVTLSCGVLLTRAYLQVHKRLLLWSAVCFFGLAISNLLTFLDLVIFTHIDMYRWRLLTATAAMLVLLFGLVWERDQ